MILLDNIPHGEEIGRHHPWPRAVVADAGWKKAIDLLARGRCTLLGLWGDGSRCPDVAVLAEGIDKSFAELRNLADGAGHDPWEGATS